MKAIVAGIEHFMNWRAATVQCDRCNTQYRTPMCWFPFPEEREKLAVQLRDAGWWIGGNHEYHICPECLK